jgi:hypothetical protein
MIELNTYNFLNDFSIEEQNPASLLIPEKYLNEFFKRAKNYGGVRFYVHYLLNQNSKNLEDILPKQENLKVKYQEKNQNLKKINFRPQGQDWSKLKELRFTSKFSISGILVNLILTDIDKMNKDYSLYTS